MQKGPAPSFLHFWMCLYSGDRHAVPARSRVLLRKDREQT